MKRIIVYLMLCSGLYSYCQYPIVNLKLSIGYSVAGRSSVIQSTSQQSGGMSIQWKYTKRFIGLTEFGTVFMQNINPYVDGHRAGYFGLGCGYRVLDTTDKFVVIVLPQIAGFTMVASNENPFDKINSRWRQSGVKIEGSFQCRNRLSLCAAYVRYFPVHFGQSDFQSFVQFGVNIRLNRNRS